MDCLAHTFRLGNLFAGGFVENEGLQLLRWGCAFFNRGHDSWTAQELGSDERKSGISRGSLIALTHEQCFVTDLQKSKR